MAFVKRFQEFFCIFLSEFDKREIVIPILQKDSLSQREKQSPSPINYSPNNPLIQTKKHRKPMPFWLLYIAPSQAMRKGHRINEFSPQGLPEGVRRYAEWLNSLIAKGILIKIGANKFSPLKQKGIENYAFPAFPDCAFTGDEKIELKWRNRIKAMLWRSPKAYRVYAERWGSSI